MNEEKASHADAEATYGTGAVVLHWIVTLMIVGMATFGLYMETINGKAQDPWVNVHGCVGLIFSVLVVSRLIWRIMTPPPPLPANTNALARMTSTPVHWLLYGLMLVIAVPGFIAFVWHGRAFNYGLFSLNEVVPESRTGV